MEREIRDLKFLIGQILARLDEVHPQRISELRNTVSFHSLEKMESLTFSCRSAPGAPKSFVEFGVENYTEANTLFLLQQHNWRGLIIDGNSDSINAVLSRETFWRHNLIAKSAFITRDNINNIISDAGFNGKSDYLVST